MSYLHYSNVLAMTTRIAVCLTQARPKPPKMKCHLYIKIWLITFYHNHVCLSAEACIQLEASTRTHSRSEHWCDERKLRITASIMKEVCHRKATTSCEAFVQKKLSSRHIDTAAIHYGKDHESTAVKSYVDYQNKLGKAVKVKLIHVVYQCIHLHPGLLEVLMELSLILPRNVIIEGVYWVLSCTEQL